MGTTIRDAAGTKLVNPDAAVPIAGTRHKAPYDPATFMLRTDMTNLLPVALCLGLLTSLQAQSGFAPPSLEPALNSSSVDTNPHLSFDGLVLYFESNRAGGAGGQDLWSSTRPYVGGPWSPPILDAGLSTGSSDGSPFLDLTGTEIHFSSNRPGSQSVDLWRATRPAPGQPWTAPQPVTELNSSGGELQFSMPIDGLECFFLTTGWGNPGGANNSIYTATRASSGSPWNPPTLVAELFNGNTHRDCEISPDGLEIVYTEFSLSRLRVFAATRPDRSSPFGTPVLWTEFDNTGTLSGVFGVTLSRQRDEIVLGAGFAAAAGNQELLRARRSVRYGTGCGAPNPLDIGASVPTLGTNWQIDTYQLEPGSPIGITVIGGAPTNLPLAALGAPGCSQYVDFVLATLVLPSNNGITSLQVPIPNAAAFAGLAFWAQSAALTTSNQLGVSFSPGVLGVLGG